jgi:carbonic anhydrase/acetyltransferase-like protein (isoleucine patch superfamily)
MHALVLPFDGKQPLFGPDVFRAPTSTVIGDVVIGERTSIWYGAILRGDVHSIRIGMDTNIQDAVVVHGTLGEFPVIVGDRVSVGHSATLHGCVIEDDVLIGIGARVLDGVRIGAGSLVAAGALVREGTIVPPRSLVVGVPAVVKRQVTERELELIRRTPGRYRELARQHMAAIAKATTKR